MKGFVLAVSFFSAALLILPLAFSPCAKPEALARPTLASAAAVTHSFTVLNAKTDEIEVMDAADYVRGVVAAEMPASYNAEALKAQAVAAFSETVWNHEQNRKNPASHTQFNGADVSTDPAHCAAFLSEDEAQKEWGGRFERDWSKICAAVDAVKNQVLLYNSEPALAVYCDMSAGVTESGKDVWGMDLPYLQEVASPGDVGMPGFESQKTIPADDFKKKFISTYGVSLTGDPKSWIKNIKRSAAGGVITAQIGEKTLTGEKIRILFNLRSANFTVTFGSGGFSFDVRGFGHGVGMSQCGAEYMAEHGKTYGEILNWYFKGVTLADYGWPDG